MKKFNFTAKILTAAVAAVTLAFSASAAEVKDISGHWSEEYVEYGIANGYINGYPDGTFLPDKEVTRAEFAKMINSALGITKTSDASFFDVEQTDWFYSEVGKALYAGYVSGYEDGSFRAQNIITRQEAAVILSRIASLPEVEKLIDSFADSKEVADWAKTAFDFAYSKGFFSGDDLGRLNPKATLTRGQAAKLLHVLKEGENVCKGDYNITLENAVCSETLFTDNVYLEAAGDEPVLSLDSCTILGTLYIRTKNPCTVTVEDSKIKNIVMDASYVTIVTKGKTDIKDVAVETPVSLNGNGFKNVTLKGGKLSSGTTELLGEFDNVTVSSDAVIKASEIKKFNVDKGISLTVQSGTVKDMTVDKAASDSVITLSAGVTVEKLTVGAPCAFKGTGVIKNANNKVDGVTYTVKPEKVTGKTGNVDSGKEENKNDTKDFGPVSVNPKMGEENVPVNVNFTVNFGEAIYDADGKSVTAQYITSNVLFKKGASKIDFVAKLTSSSKFELDPTSMLAYDKEYTVTFPAGIFKDKNGNTNPKIVYNFTTREDFDEDDYESGSGSSGSGSSATSSTIKFSVESGEKNVAINEELKVTFSTAIKRQSGSAVTDSYLSNTAFELREESKNGTRVGIIAEANSTKKTVTITPEQPLKPGMKYYLIIASGTLKFDGGANISSKSVYFTTSDDIGMTTTPRNNATGVALNTEIKLEFNSEIYLPDGSKIDENDLYEFVQLKEKSTSGKDVDFDITLSSDKKTVTIKPAGDLEQGTSYYVIIPKGSIANENETENDKLQITFKTISEMQPELSPVDGDDKVGLTDKVIIKFAEPVYYKDSKTKKITELDDTFIEDLINDKYITLYREGYTTNLLKNADIKISSDFKTITLTPSKSLGSNRVYVLTVASGKFYNAEGKKSNLKATSTFSTPSTGIPEFSPEDGATEIPVDEKIEITFDDIMRSVNGNALTATDVQNRIITIYKGSLDGETVAFTAKISEDKQKFTITPKKDLAGGTKYFVEISAETMIDSTGKENKGYYISFTTEEAVEEGCEITPKNKATNVPLNTTIVIEYESKLCKKNGEVVTETYLKNNGIITLKDGNTSSAKDVDFDIEVSDDGKTLTLIPAENLAPEKTYYVKVVKGSLYYFDGSLVDAESSSFKTGTEIEEPEEPEEPDEDDLVITAVSFKTGMGTGWGGKQDLYEDDGVTLKYDFQEDLKDGKLDIVTFKALEKFEFYVETNLGKTIDKNSVVTLELADNITMEDGIATAPLNDDGTGTFEVTVVTAGNQKKTFTINVSVNS